MKGTDRWVDICETPFKGLFGNHTFSKIYILIFVSVLQVNTCIEILCKLGAKIGMCSAKISALRAKNHIFLKTSPDPDFQENMKSDIQGIFSLKLIRVRLATTFYPYFHTFQFYHTRFEKSVLKTKLVEYRIYI